ATIDPNATPASDFRPYPATLPPAEPGVHRVTLRISDQTRPVAPGVTQRMWTFGGTVPGPALRGRVGDRFIVTLVNDTDMTHSIDFHASRVAPDLAMRDIPPGGRLVYQFTAEHAGAWMYHCATKPMTQHIGNGMYGAVVIDPPHLAPVSAEYLLVQSELYLGPDGQPADAAKTANGTPDAVVFNGYADQYRHRPLPAPVGGRVRIWVVNAGLERPSSFHVVGTQLDTVFADGAYLVRPGNPARGAAQALALQPGQGGFVEFTLPAPGHYPFLTHLMVDAERGAAGVLAATR
ncbi:MAG: multicopper oxidase domain-containing protein, partial [Micromonosporaceae bacterium]|nr:multicopper oxidase domain-containing protein [Micromonosporaceae bacterium]